VVCHLYTVGLHGMRWAIIKVTNFWLVEVRDSLLCRRHDYVLFPLGRDRVERQLSRGSPLTNARDRQVKSEQVKIVHFTFL
jgi:hypothetical protein